MGPGVRETTHDLPVQPQSTSYAAHDDRLLSLVDLVYEQSVRTGQEADDLPEPRVDLQGVRGCVFRLRAGTERVS